MVRDTVLVAAEFRIQPAARAKTGAEPLAAKPANPLDANDRPPACFADRLHTPSRLFSA
jgi:hypothetical protein